MQLGVPSDLFKGELVEFIFRVCCIIDQATFDQNFFGKTTLESSLSFCWIFLIHSQNHFCVFGMEMLPNQTFLSRLAVLMRQFLLLRGKGEFPTGPLFGQLFAKLLQSVEKLYASPKRWYNLGNTCHQNMNHHG